MIYNGYVLIPHETYLAWKNSVLNNGYNADNIYGCQCWDLTAEFWYNVGFPTNYPITQPGGDGVAYQCWTISRFQNISYNGVQYFELIEDKTQIRQGDVVVYDSFYGGGTGHIGFADENYNGTNSIRMLGQNQGNGTPTPQGGSTTSLQTYDLSHFLGAFRYIAWQTPRPIPTTNWGKTRFPWAIYARKFRERNSLY